MCFGWHGVPGAVTLPRATAALPLVLDVTELNVSETQTRLDQLLGTVTTSLGGVCARQQQGFVITSGFGMRLQHGLQQIGFRVERMGSTSLRRVRNLSTRPEQAACAHPLT
eukprot:scaffold158_cov388-Prasinococcus_capsulatus_cf.AAC.11